ncbi:MULTISPECIES: MarR family winged helix-turn-helix transcriptional regulator [Flavobacterium]|uniref:MarR family transcriptional regulator n=1 Tax=Flavobacterium lipolyticum TaxID=2893754 RepID=A0ABS8M427_9FLAO|nr:MULTISPECIES: MarR family transcriptional regulator [unclassified Flavobacterium]MCC9019574.1 MarR family transcriptional regulator [Flavobacterium sp. F-126]
MQLENPTGTALYSLEKAIKEYRRLAQKNITKVVKDITVDQCLVLIILNNNPDISQNELANLVFKDSASITRMIELMVKKEYISRTIHPVDRRKFNLEITKKGKKTLDDIQPVIKINRQTALEGLSLEEIALLDKTLHKIIINCKNN